MYLSAAEGSIWDKKLAGCMLRLQYTGKRGICMWTTCLSMYRSHKAVTEVAKETGRVYAQVAIHWQERNLHVHHMF